MKFFIAFLTTLNYDKGLVLLERIEAQPFIPEISNISNVHVVATYLN